MWYNLWQFGIFSRFGMMYGEKSGNLDREVVFKWLYFYHHCVSNETLFCSSKLIRATFRLFVITVKRTLSILSTTWIFCLSSQATRIYFNILRGPDELFVKLKQSIQIYISVSITTLCRVRRALRQEAVT
jgi:hypothetical protein